MHLSQPRRLPQPPAPEPRLPAELPPCFPRVVRLRQTCRLRSGPGAARLPPRRPLNLLRSPRCRTSATSRKRRGKSSWLSWIVRRKKRRRSSPCSSKDPAPSSRLPPCPPPPSAASPRPPARRGSPPFLPAGGAGATRAAARGRQGRFLVVSRGGVCRGGRAPRPAEVTVASSGRRRFPRRPPAFPAGHFGSRDEAEPWLLASHFLSRRPRAEAVTGARNPIWPCTGAPGPDPGEAPRPGVPVPPGSLVPRLRGPAPSPAPGGAALPTVAADRKAAGRARGPKRGLVSSRVGVRPPPSSSPSPSAGANTLHSAAVLPVCN